MRFFELEKECKKRRFKLAILYTIIILSWLFSFLFLKELLDLSYEKEVKAKYLKEINKELSIKQ
jgi:hypothetical protein